MGRVLMSEVHAVISHVLFLLSLERLGKHSITLGFSLFRGQLLGFGSSREVLEYR
jgi:hypothetical protein